MGTLSAHAAPSLRSCCQDMAMSGFRRDNSTLCTSGLGLRVRNKVAIPQAAALLIRTSQPITRRPSNQMLLQKNTCSSGTKTRDLALGAMVRVLVREAVRLVLGVRGLCSKE